MCAIAECYYYYDYCNVWRERVRLDYCGSCRIKLCCWLYIFLFFCCFFASFVLSNIVFFFLLMLKLCCFLVFFFVFLFLPFILFRFFFILNDSFVSSLNYFFCCIHFGLLPECTQLLCCCYCRCCCWYDVPLLQYFLILLHLLYLSYSNSWLKIHRFCIVYFLYFSSFCAFYLRFFFFFLFKYHLSDHRWTVNEEQSKAKLTKREEIMMNWCDSLLLFA